MNMSRTSERIQSELAKIEARLSASASNLSQEGKTTLQTARRTLEWVLSDVDAPLIDLTANSFSLNHEGGENRESIEPADPLCAMWGSAMKDAERLISETSDERLIHRLKLSIKLFKYMLEIGEPFPGQ